MAKRTVFIDSDSEEEHAERALGSIEEQQDEAVAQETEDVDEETEKTEEDERASGSGLTAAELRDERLFPGDTIEYYSMAFVFGDPRGYHVAKVLKVSPSERQYPLGLDSQEMLPCTQMIKRQLNRRGEALEPGTAVWRKIRTFDLVEGEIKGKTRADILNEGLKSAVSDAFASMRAELGKNDTKKKPKSSRYISAFFTKTSSTSSSLEKRSARPAFPKNSMGRQRYIDDSPPVPKSVLKRPRIELTPELRLDSRKKQHRALPPKLDRYSEKQSRPSSSEMRRDGSPGKRPKIRLQAYVESLEEMKRDPRTGLDDYLVFDNQQKKAIEELGKKETITRNERCADRPSSGSSSNRMRVSSTGKSDAGRGTRKREKMRTLHHFYKGPPRPAADKPTGATSLSFIMDAENDSAFERRANEASVQKNRNGEGKIRQRDHVKLPVKKGLAPTQSHMGKWINKGKR